MPRTILTCSKTRLRSASSLGSWNTKAPSFDRSAITLSTACFTSSSVKSLARRRAPAAHSKEPRRWPWLLHSRRVAASTMIITGSCSWARRSARSGARGLGRGEHPDGLGGLQIAVHLRHILGGLALIVLGGGVGAEFDQEADHRRVVVGRGDHQRGDASLRLGVHVGAALDETLGDDRSAACCRARRRRPPPASCCAAAIISGVSPSPRTARSRRRQPPSGPWPPRICPRRWRPRSGRKSSGPGFSMSAPLSSSALTVGTWSRITAAISGVMASPSAGWDRRRARSAARPSRHGDGARRWCSGVAALIVELVRRRRPCRPGT